MADVQQLPDPKKYVAAQLPRAPPPDDGSAFLAVSNILQLNTPEKKTVHFFTIDLSCREMKTRAASAMKTKSMCLLDGSLVVGAWYISS